MGVGHNKCNAVSVSHSDSNSCRLSITLHYHDFINRDVYFMVWEVWSRVGDSVPSPDDEGERAYCYKRSDLRRREGSGILYCTARLMRTEICFWLSIYSPPLRLCKTSVTIKTARNKHQNGPRDKWARQGNTRYVSLHVD